MKETTLNRLIHNMEVMMLEAELHRVFKKQVMPLRVEQKLKILPPDRIKLQ